MHAHPITEQLTDLRRGAAISRSQIAERADVRGQLLQAWEAGVYAPGLLGLLAWAGALGCAVVVQPSSGLPMLGVGVVAALTAVRRQRGLSQGQVADLAGFTQSQLSQWERGRISPGLRALGVWVDALGCELVLVPAVLAVAA